jgi:hypothetical protein
MKKMKVSVAAALMFAVMFSVSSCKKEEAVSPAGSPSADDNSVTAERAFNSPLLPPNGFLFGHIYSQWSAKWWKWAMEFPMTGHPFVDDPAFDVSARQSGPVWFLGSPVSTVVRNCTIPRGKALFVGLLNAEASDLEGLGVTAADQRANAKFNADPIINLACSIDGHAVNNITSFRFVSPQFSFTAPSPWIFGTTGGNGTAVGDGYYIMLRPLSPGNHSLHYSGAFHFAISEGDPFDYDAALDMTYNLHVQ